MILYQPDDKGESLHAQGKPGANTDFCLVESSTANLLNRVGASPALSESPSIVESVWDGSSDVYSGSPASCKDDFFTEPEINVTERYGRPPDNDGEVHNQIPLPGFLVPEGPDFYDAIPSVGNSNARRLLSDNDDKNNTFRDRAFPTSRNKHEDIGSEFEDDDFDSDDEYDDDEWGGEPDRIEAAVLTNVSDLGFAAALIMELHKDQVHNEARRIGGWQRGVVTCQSSSGLGESSRQPFIDPSTSQRAPNSRKKQRLSRSRGEGSDDGDGERDDGEGSGSPENHDDGSISGEQRGRYACPFNKYDPTRFCSNSITEDQYRVCESGYKTIQRLKEHIKRKHLLIQCERCYKNFSGKGKAIEESVAELKMHRQQPEPCAVGSSETNLGVNMEQWTLLDRSGSKKRKKISEVEKWFIYGRQFILVHPARLILVRAERTTTGMKSFPATGNTQGFARLFQMFLDHGSRSGDIQFVPGQEILMKSRLNSLAQRAYNLHVDLNETPCFGNSSSSGQTATQITMPKTPVMGNPNLTPRHISVPKMSRQNSQPMLLREPQPFRMLPQQIPPTMTYGPQNYPGYGGNQLTRVPPNPMPGPAQPLVLDRPEFHWQQPYAALANSWSEYEYLDTDNPSLPFIPQSEQS
ncbi:hypothetical protein F5Y11DRAFT_366972 [Daldinia sp. FL1419]|nr:hypothetical protein F5Y11DRAFT_366972 [Daldinia sp. FL1419]